MKKTFREYHLLNFLDSFDFTSGPLDVKLSQYFRNNKALGSKDRKIIGEKVYQLIRWMGLIDHFCEDSHQWEERCRILEALNIMKSLDNPAIPIHIRASFPKIYFTILADHFGEEQALQFCHICNTSAPTTIRANVLKTTRQKLYSKWKDQFSVTQTKHSVWGIHFEDRMNFQTLDDFRHGFFEVQDEASQLIADLIDAKPGEQILDFCSGSGGKALAFAHKLQGKGQIYLHDIRERPLYEARRRLKRAGIENGQILHHNATHKKDLIGKMDWVLVDAPCSGSGTLRRNPDMKWKFSEEMLKRLIHEQREIFKEALEYLAPQGKIVYATCSVLPQENDEQIVYFRDLLHLDLCQRPLRTFPQEGGMDGFFGAILKRSTEYLAK